MLIDSNIIIYAAKPEFQKIRDLLGNPDCVVSIVSKVEVLGYHGMDAAEHSLLQRFFDVMPTIGITDSIAERAIELRKTRKMSLGDAFIAATALVHGLTLMTRNTNDFVHIDGLTLQNPFEI